MLADYWIVECGSFDLVTEIAARLAECFGRNMSAPARRWTCTVAESQDELEL